MEYVRCGLDPAGRAILRGYKVTAVEANGLRSIHADGVGLMSSQQCCKIPAAMSRAKVSFFTLSAGWTLFLGLAFEPLTALQSVSSNRVNLASDEYPKNFPQPLSAYSAAHVEHTNKPIMGPEWCSIVFRP